MIPITPPLKSGDRGPSVGNLQEGLLLLFENGLAQSSEERRQLTELLRSERQGLAYSTGTTRVITLLQERNRLQVTGSVDVITAEFINKLLKELGAFQSDRVDSVFVVDGRVLSKRAGVGGLQVVIVDRNVGEDTGLSLAETTTRDDGNYRTTFVIPDLSRRSKEHPDLQARVFAGDVFLGGSEVRYNASNHETLNVFLTEKAASALPSELETLTSSLSTHFNGNLRELKESDQRQDITYLANKTGWDARAVALAALADQFSARTANATGTPQIESPFFYALFRAGVPANEPALYRITATNATEIWKQAIAQGVITASLETRIPRVTEQFQRIAVERSLDGPALAGISSLKEMLTVSLGEDPALHRRFAEIYAEHRNDSAKLWQTVRESLGEAAEKRLRLDGQLAYLTLNNAPLMGKVHAAGGQTGLSDSVNLAEMGYYRADKWRDLVGNDAIPPEIVGETDEERRSRYADMLAAQVRLSFPTMVVAQMVREGTTPVAAAHLDQVHAFLIEHQGEFEIGMQPVERYIARNQLQVSKEVAKEIARIQRVYQITPSDSAMNALLESGVDSALAVSRYDQDEFVRRFANELGGEAHARLTHAKARQVHNVVLNLAYSYLSSRTAPQIGMHSPAKYSNTTPAPVVKAQEAVANNLASNIGSWLLDVWSSESADNASDVISYATLEALFGEMDYCACEHCKSVLSPAAYLVDLLHFLDRNGQGADKNPLNIFLARRPDVEHLPLTCENTNTSLPYIDLVNETLEYYVIHNLSLTAYRGHTTDDTVGPEELLASPQFVEDKAYETLAGKHEANEPPPLLPPTPPLPFHQPLETLRRYFDKFEAPLPEVMEGLRTNDDIERPAPVDPANPVEYGWRDILMEELRLSRDEYTRLTDDSLTLNAVYGFKPETSNTDVMASLSNARAFARRMQISYEDVIAILKSRFVNPSSTLVPKLEELGVPFLTLKAFKDGTMNDDEKAEFDELISGLDASHFGGDIKAWITNDTNYARIMSLITLTDTNEDVLCSFDHVEFRYANPVLSNTLRPFEFHRLIRFVRLWKKLGWSIEQTDKAITALYPESQNPNSPDDTINLQLLDQGFLIKLPRLGVIRRLMKILKLKPKKDLLALLACFAPIDTHGTESLYRQMFLSPAPTEKPNPFADDGFGNYLTKDEKLSDHLEPIRAAFLLTDDEVKHITASLKYDDETLLKIETISAIFRRGWLARKLKLSVREFLLLINMTGIDPFAPPDPPVPPILRFLDVVNGLRAASLKPAQALYLIWNQDISGKSVPARDEILGFARALRTAFTAIESEFALTDDPNGQIARTRMALVYGNDVTNFFFGLLDNTLVTEVQYDHHQDKLEQHLLDAAPGRISYDDFRKRLSFSGVMTETTRDALKVGATLEFETAVDNLYNENQKLINPFLARFPELLPLHDAFVFFGELKSTVGYAHSQPNLEQPLLAVAPGRISYDDASKTLSFKGVLPVVTRDALKAVSGVTPQFQTAIDSLFAANQAAIQAFFANHPALVAQQENYLAANDLLEQRRSLLLQSFLPELKSRRKRQQALAAISAAAKTDIAVASALLDDKEVLNPAAALDGPALDDLTAMETAGLSAKMYSGTAVGGEGVQPDQVSDAEANLAYAATGESSLPFNPASVIWTGYLEAPENGFYNFSINPAAPGGPGATTATLTLNDENKPLAKDGEVWSNTTPIELRAGTLYSITLKLENITAGVDLRWQTKGRGWEVIPSPYLYSETLVSHLRATYLRFLKGASLTAALKLEASEMAYFAGAETYQIGGRGWLNSLPVAGTPDTTTGVSLLEPFEALLNFAALKVALSPNDERLLIVLKDPNAIIETADTTPLHDENSLLLALTRWDGESLDALLLRFGKNIQGQPNEADRGALKELATFQRIYRAYALVKKIGVSAAALIAATANEPKAVAVQNFKAALRARYEQSDWLNVLRPINDEMRGLQRDALVAYILHQLRADPLSEHIDTPEKLFEYFLMDVQMDPCMQTSRIRHALSSVQLFTERCFMNLETSVAPSVFETEQRKQWEWMKRYRVWEANRKVFLWPENWVEPELRGDQSPFFKEAMSELLQSDITEDRAATALLNYLTKLEEVAKLEPCGIHFVEGNSGTADDEAHVVARTAGGNRKYFYRRYEDGLWTPWEQIKLDIEDNPVVPVVWKDRLFLFWLRILKQAPLNPPPAPQPAEGETLSLANVDASAMIPHKVPQVTVQAVLCWSEYYDGKWQAAKTSDINRPTDLGPFPATGAGAFDRSALYLWIADVENALLIGVLGAQDAWFILYNTHSLPLRGEDEDSGVVSSAAYSAYFNGPTRFLESSAPTFALGYRATFNDDLLDRPILSLKGDLRFRMIQSIHVPQNPWTTPFLYEDTQHAFYVTTKKTSVRIGQWLSYYDGWNSAMYQSIPSLVMPEYQPPGPGPYESVFIGQGDPYYMKRFVSEDAYIKKGIPMTNTVRLDGAQIGPGGRVTNTIQK
ncbi:MAG TPA: neuraminidase-like domain-containing protein [Pyrinomonadaceae bacterium]